MCRFLCYMGPEVLLADLLYQPKNSLILQSYKSRERKEPLNGDGFGVGWYTAPSGPTPCIFTSITPAWNNRNLMEIERHGSRVETSSLYRRGRQSNDQFHTR